MNIQQIFILYYYRQTYMFFLKNLRDFHAVEENSSKQNTFHPFFLCNFRNYESATNLKNYSFRLLLLGVAISFVNKE